MVAIIKFIFFILLFALGFTVAFIFLNPKTTKKIPVPKTPVVIGFLPYWLVDKAQKDYSKEISTLTYFGLTISPDGSIQKYSRPGEAEPGWNKLATTNFDHKMKLSLLVFSGVPSSIDNLISDPASHAATLVTEVQPIMDQYGFTGLNMDIEDVSPASPSAQQNFTDFVAEIRKNIKGTLTLEFSPSDLIHDRLINVKLVEPYVDHFVLMAYDYHYSGSLVTGAVSPNFGAGLENEFDVETAIQKALELIPSEKLILGVPLYGYEWETINGTPRSAVIAGSGQVASNNRAEALTASYSAQFDQISQEAYIIYKDEQTGTYHQIFYPDQRSTQAKIALANKYDLAGLAFWALGYDGETILKPVEGYLQK